MRTELATIAYIEKYLLNVLTDVEKQAFEKQMETDPDFKNEVDLQEQLVTSLERLSLQQSIQNAHHSYTFWKFWKLLGMIVIPIVLILATWYFLSISKEDSNINNHTQSTTQTQQEKAPVSTKTITKEIVSDPDRIPKEKPKRVTATNTAIFAAHVVVNPLEKTQTEIFSISTEKDTIVETKNGLVFLIPEQTFIDTEKNIVTGIIDLEIKEAIDPITIMSSGFATLHNGKLLETGGMFFLEATKDGKTLQIHPEKEITADIPTQDYKEGMQLFDGEVAENGTINWVNPKPLHKTLIPHDIYSLNFYPPKYLETLAKKGYDKTDKKFTDSLYYSFKHKLQNKRDVDTIMHVSDLISKDSLKIRDRITQREVETIILGINPLKIKAIWNDHFQQTFIATKEFEKRLQLLHQSCGNVNHFLDLYIEHLDWDLSKIDAIVADFIPSKFKQQFIDFSKEGLTNVANLSSDIKKLNQYYLSQQKVYRLALEKTQQRIDSLIQVDTKYQNFSKQQLEDFYTKEFSITTQKVMNELNIPMPRTINSAVNNPIRTTQNNTTTIVNIIKKEKNKRRYRASIRTTGWKNIDRIINEAVISSLRERTTTTVQVNNETSTISYTEYEVSIKNTEQFDQLSVYLVPKEFNSFIRLNSNNDLFTYKLNDLLEYQIYCIGYINEIPYYFSQPVINTSDQVTLTKTTKEALFKKLAVIKNSNSSIEKDISHQMFRRKNGKTVKRYREMIQLKGQLQPIIFPCKSPAKTLSTSPIIKTDTIITVQFKENGN